ncbi:MAG: hypothetical protein WBV94_32980 [Blastocatellia bacterium]
MIKAVILAFVLMPLVACGDAPRTASVEAQSFSILSEYPNPATGSVIVIIRVAKTSTPPQVKAAVESVIASRKDRYRHITVKTFLEGASLDSPPFAVSTLRDDVTEHVFGTIPGGSVRIPTH